MAFTTDFKELVTSLEVSRSLVKLGLHRAAVFHWYEATEEPGETKYEVGRLLEPNETNYPAWTYEELRIMIGNKHQGADLPEPRPKPIDGEWENYTVFFPTKGVSYAKGADANAGILIFLIENGWIKADQANERYFSKFKPQ